MMYDKDKLSEMEVDLQNLQGQSNLQMLSWNCFHKSMLLSQSLKNLLKILVAQTSLFSYL